MAYFAVCGIAVFFALLHCVMSGSILDVEHIVIFMQENRAFDHYYGTLQGVRGFNDRTAIRLPSGRPAWYQPTNAFNLTDYMLPFHVDTLTTSAICMDAPTMNYPTDIGIWNGGLYDGWNTARSPGMGMSYFERTDLPFYYALADNFVIGDQYFQSTFTETNPNRLHLFSGSNGLSVGHYPVLNNTEPNPGWNWITMAEVLEKANISWRVYQQFDNFDDNGFAWFESFMSAGPGNPLYEKGMVRVNDLVQEFAADINSGRLPQVSWIVGPTNQSEHATNHPAAGEDLTARLLKVLSANATVYAKTAFILNYDEGGQFFDHHWTPTPPTKGNGVSTVTTDGELTDVGAPIGLGFRVPLMIISPWTRGNAVVSQVLDHTSVVRFVEERFGVTCPNISPWRRAVCGDLTTAFDFDSPDYSWPQLPDTSRYVVNADVECETLPPPQVPVNQSLPSQETGIRVSRALPYEFSASGRTMPGDSQHFYLDLVNTGKGGAPFVAFDLIGPSNTPRQYAVEAGANISDSWTLASAAGNYSFALHGPNGWVRVFSGAAADVDATQTPVPSAQLQYNVADESVTLQLMNDGPAPMTFNVAWNAYRSDGPWQINVAAKSGTSVTWPIADSGFWYDITATATSPPLGGFARRYMGRMETGRDSISDPAMGSGALHSYTPPRCHPPARDAYCPLSPAVKG